MTLLRHIILVAFTLLCVVLFSSVAWGQEPEAGSQVTARAWVLEDLHSGEVLAESASSRRLPMASTTKIMLALVVLESNVGLEEEVTVSREAASYARPPYSYVGLRAGDRASVGELLEAALIPSGNDAAYALAGYVGDGSVERFVGMMNRKAEEMGLSDTHFENPEGLDEEGHYTSAVDLARMTRAAFEHPVFREIVSTQQTAITVSGRRMELENTNDLLFTYPPASGVKTGFTLGAGPSLVATAGRGDESYVAVVLNAPDRFGAARTLLSYGFSNYDRRVLVKEGRRYASEPLPYRDEQKVRLVADRRLSELVEKGSPVDRVVSIMEELPPSAEKGDRLGSITVNVGGERAGSVALVAAEGYEEASLWQRIWYTAREVFNGDKEKKA